MRRATTLMPPRRAALALGICAALGAHGAAALEWTTNPTVQLLATTDDNFRLRTVEPRDVTASRVDARAAFVGESERVRFSLEPRLNAIEYSDDREFDRRDAYLNTSLDLRNERRVFSLGANLAQDGTLTNAFDNSGYYDTDLDRDSAQYSFGYTALTSERNQFSLSLANQSVRYADPETGSSPLVDYDYAALSLTYAHTLTDRASLELTLKGAELSTELPLDPTDTSGLSIAFAGDLSETLSYRVGFGRDRARGPELLDSGKTTDSTVDLSVSKRWERSTLRASLAAATEPSAYGVLYHRESFAFDFTHRFRERVSASLRLSAGHVESDQPLLRSEERDYTSGTLSVDWRFAQRLSLTFTAGTREQAYFDDPSAQGTFGEVGFVYRGRRR